MTAGPDGGVARQAAAQMRSILARRWDPHGDPGVAAEQLKAMFDDVAALVPLDNALTIFDAPALGDVYAFLAAVNKTVTQQHSAQPPDRRATSRTAFLEDIRAQFPYFYQRQQQLLAALDRSYPQD